MKVYFIRHAESIENSTQVHLGVDTPLSNEGKKQAILIANRLKSFKIDHIYTSIDIRAVDTAKIISGVIGKNFKVTSDLSELRNPTEILELPYTHPETVRISRLIRNNFHKSSWKFSDEENFFEFKTRLINFLRKLVKDNKNNEVICISHRITIKMFLALVIFGGKVGPRQFLIIREHIWFENTGISIFEYTSKYGWSLISWNDYCHLSDNK